MRFASSTVIKLLTTTRPTFTNNPRIRIAPRNINMGAYTSKANTPEERNGTPKQSISSPENSKINLLSQEEQKDKHKISKNQLKRERKWQEKMEVKRRRKEQERNIRIAHAKVEGRDIEMERKIMEINRKNGAGWAKRDKKWKEDFEKKASKYQICIDCSFEKEMSTKEINSLASQIRYCYAANKRAKCPVHVKTTSLNGETLKKLQNVSGFSSWSNRAFGNSPESMEQVYDKTKLVYLTSDSDNELSKLEDDKVYVIGGIVDRNRLKRVAISRAEDLGVVTAKLPISSYLDMLSTKVLTCNHVFEILLKYGEHGENWKKSFLDVLPIRKDAKGKDA